MLKVPIPKHYVHGRDQRSQELIEQQNVIIQNLCSQNEKNFKSLVEQESKKEIVKFKNEKLEAKLSGGRYVTYTDRTSNTNQININLPAILTLHGIPGTLQDFLPIQHSLQARFACRWINLSLPGLDGKEERRGVFRGYLEDVNLLINDFLDEMKIDKVILIMHSGGGMYGKSFAFAYPHRIKALVQLASIGIEMWPPILMQNTLFKQMGIDVLKITKEEIETEKFRNSFSEKVREFVKTLENNPNKNLQIWKLLSVYHHFMLLKAQVYQGGFEQFFVNIKNIDKNIPRFFGYSTIDTLIPETHIQQDIFNCILSDEAMKFKLIDEKQIDSTFKLQEQGNILKNFVFSYSDSGHAFQYHKGFDISIKLMVFIQILDQLKPNQKQNELKPNL